MKKVEMRYLFLFVMFLPLFAVENNIFTGFGVGLGSKYKTDFWQQTTRDNNNCAGGTCIGNKTSGSYVGDKSKTFSATLGDEIFFDKYYISGVRVSGTIEYASVSLGSLVAGSTKNKPARDTKFQTVTGTGADKSPIIGDASMVSVPNPQRDLFSNGVWIAYSVKIDFFLNLPIDIIVQKLFWDKMPFFKIGIYAGGGAEYATLKSNSWLNETIGKSEKFFASGSGVFADFGASVYIGRHNRFNVGLKIPYYGLNAQNWYDYGSTDPWKQQTLRQNFDVFKEKELHLSYVYLF